MTRASGGEPVTIAGGGPVGTLPALLLAQRGRQVRIFERRADPRRSAPERGRSINLALAARGLGALERAGALGRVSSEMVMMRGRQLHELDGSGALLPYGLRDSEVIYSISRARLNTVLIESAAAAGIELHFGTRCLDYAPRSGTLTLQSEDGAVRALSAPLLIAADGAGSAIRSALASAGQLRFSEAPLAHDYKEFLIAAHNGSYALEPHALHIWPRGGFMLIALPNADGSFTATLFLARNGAPGFDQLQSPAAVAAFFAREFPDVPPLLPDLCTQFAEHPQGRLATLTCTPWSVGSCVLLGDAAHAILPFHGQGLNCGFEDCLLLDELLATRVAPAAAFAAYEQIRRPDTEAIAAMALENYEEMRDTVRAPDFARRRALAAWLEQQFPGRFIPRYSMVMFHAEIPYAEARRRGALQEQVLDALLAQAAGPVPERALAEQQLAAVGL